jgi:osmotically-inducible protein OsmY
MAVIDKLRALQIKANIIADRTVGMMEINTQVHGGVAVLAGDVETEEQKRIAEELAWDVEGVHEVRNEIRVVPRSPDAERDDAHLGYGPAEGSVGDTAFSIDGGYEVPGPGIPTTEQFPGQFTDEEVEEEVYDKLATQHEVEISDVEIESANQIVYLKGSVRTYEDLARLHDMVLNIRGVMGISSEVAVREGEVGTPKDQM